MSFLKVYSYNVNKHLYGLTRKTGTHVTVTQGSLDLYTAALITAPHGQLQCIMIDWLIIYRFISCSRIFQLYRNVTFTGEGMQNLGIMLGTQGLTAGMDLSHATPNMTQGLCFFLVSSEKLPHSVAFYKRPRGHIAHLSHIG
jgi:hypothetical protein